MIFKKCLTCGNKFIFEKGRREKYCSFKCINRNCSDETRNKMSISQKKQLNGKMPKGFDKMREGRETKIIDWKTGEKHHNWKGNEANKVTKHKWLDRKYGQPKYCEHCKRTDKKKYEWANKDHQYNRTIDDFIRLCTSCHRKYDIKFNGYTVHIMN